MTTNMRVRRARKSRPCGGDYITSIKPGDLYIEHTEFPGGDAVFADAAGHPVRMAECRECAERYGRGHLFPDHEGGPK